MAVQALDLRLAAIAERVRVMVGPATEPISAAAAALAASSSAAVIADEIVQITKAARLLVEMVEACQPEMGEDGSIETMCSRLRHDLRTPLVALKGYGELVLEIAVDEGLDTVSAALGPLLEGVADVMVAIERALPALSRAMTVEEEGDDEPGAISYPTGRVLVADDSQANRDVLVKYLSREGHEVVAVADGLAAVEAVFEQSFDVVLLDMIMPGMNGDGVLKAMKAEPRLRSLPVIMISALDALDSIVCCIEAGAEDYLPKPFNRVLLRARIGACLEKKRLREIELSYLKAMEKELTIARDVQRSILPKAFPAHHALVGHGLMDPAREIGGDFYDFFALDDDRIGVAVGDVSGKGVPAAVYMAMVRTQLRATALFGLSPAECLYRLNDHLSADNAEGMFVSLFYGIIDCANGIFTYANGGHNWPVVLRADGTVEWVQGTDDLLVGVVYGSPYHNATLTLAPGDSLFIYTDGVVEAIDPAEDEFGKHRLAAILAEMVPAEPAGLCDGVLAAVRAFEGGQPHSDDLTCVAVRFLGDGNDASCFEMRIATDITEIGRLVPAVHAYFQRRAISPEVTYSLTMAIEEAVSNVIRHGYGDSHGEGHTITVRVREESDGDQVVAEVIDDGASFDPTAADSQESGLGIGLLLIKTMVDGIEYVRDAECNRLHMIKSHPRSRMLPS
ncbi:Serine phosphatase RsbU regulator sigma subunit (modular protein) [Candidatus Terasakiella magnetica]|nr:Serine phosphatase RsbU regulator sigma subunit (modular protein) [Candidatus Terasakiella magnetica]